MSKLFKNDDELVTSMGELPASISPRSDLWPGIAARLNDIDEHGRQINTGTGWRLQAVAASLVITFVAGLMFGRQIGDTEVPAYHGPAIELAWQATLEATEREYRAAFREFIPVGAASTLLDFQAVEHIENSWAETQRAETALLAALRDYPDNTFLNQKLLELRSRQLGFMKQLAMLDQISRRRT